MDTIVSEKNDKLSIKEAREKRLADAEQKKKSLYTAIGGVATVVVLGLVAWNQGIFKTTTPAFTIDGTEYTSNQVQMYYQSNLYSALYGQYEPGVGGEAYDMMTPADEQFYSASSPKFLTWHEFFVEEAVMTLGEVHAISEIAKKAGFVLPEEGEASLASTKASLELAWIGYTPNKESYIRAYYGDDMTEKKYLDMTERELLSNYYKTELYENYEYDLSDCEEYYKENQDDLDEVTYTQFHFTTNPVFLTYDEDGVAEDLSEEEEAAFDEDKEERGLLADEVLEFMENGGTVEEAVDKFSEVASSVVISNTQLGSSLSGEATYGTWLLDQDREALDVQKTGSGTGYNATYTITIFEERERTEATLANIRHIYIAANEEGTPTEEEWDEAEDRAQEMLDQWIADGSDLEEFALLATEHSADSGSAAVGGVIENVSTFSGYVDTFADWALDPSRKEGDTGIVKNTGSAVQGWHIMYYEEDAGTLWEKTSKVQLANTELETWIEDIRADLEESIVYGPGMDDIEMTSLFG